MKKATQSKAWTTVQIARHPERPQFLDYVGEIFTEFDALHG
ncbi:acetyl-CoA carboxylase carboxyl transferase subunit alpha, partial [Acinetobacter baumannii]